MNFDLPIQGGASEGSCGPCPAGSFCPGLGLSSPISSCVAGSECSWDLRTSSPMAFLCPQVSSQELQEGAWSPRLGEARDPHPGFKLESSGCGPQASTLPFPRSQFFLQCPHPASWPPVPQSPWPEPAGRKDNALTFLSTQPHPAWLSERPLCVQCPGSLLPTRVCLA